MAHEALIRYWPRLRGWLEEDLADLRLREESARRPWTGRPARATNRSCCTGGPPGRRGSAGHARAGGAQSPGAGLRAGLCRPAEAGGLTPPAPRGGAGCGAGGDPGGGRRRLRDAGAGHPAGGPGDVTRAGRRRHGAAPHRPRAWRAAGGRGPAPGANGGGRRGLAGGPLALAGAGHPARDGADVTALAYSSSGDLLVTAGGDGSGAGVGRHHGRGQGHAAGARAARCAASPSVPCPRASWC